MTREEEYRNALNGYRNIDVPINKTLRLVGISAIKMQIPQEVVNQGGTPLSGYCPRCNAQLTKPSSPVGCKWCLQRLSWDETREALDRNSKGDKEE